MIGDRAEGDNLLGRQIGGDLHVRQQLLQGGDQRRRIQVAGGVGPQLLLLAGGGFHIHLPQGLLDAAVQTQRRIDQHAIVLRVERQFEGRVELFEHVEGRLSRSPLDRVRDQHRGLRRLAGAGERIERFGQLLVLRRLRPDRQFSGLRILDHAHAGKPLQQIGLHRLEPRALGDIQRVEPQHLLLGQRRTLCHLLNRLPHTLLVFGRRHDHQPPGLRIPAHFRRRDHARQHSRDVGRHGLIDQRIELQDRLGGRQRVLLEPVDHLGKLGVLGLRPPHDEPVLRGIDRDGRLLHQRLQQRLQLRRRHALHGIELQNRLPLRLDRLLQLPDQRLDLLVVGRAGDDAQLPPVARERGFRAGDERLERRHIGGCELLGERINHQRGLLARRRHLLPLIEQLLDDGLIHHAGHRRHLPPVRAERQLSVRDHGAQQREHGLIETFVQRVELQCRRVFQRRLLIQLFHQRLDHRLRRRRGADHHAARLRVGRDVGAGSQLLDQRGQRGGVEPLGHVHHHLLAFLIDIPPQLLHRRLDLLLVLRLREYQQAFGRDVDRRLRLGQHRLQLLDQIRSRVRVQRHAAQRVDLQTGLRVRRPIRLHLVDRRFDRLLLGRRRIRHDLIHFVVDLELRVGEQDRQCLDSGGRVNGRHRIHHQDRRRRGRRLLAFFLPRRRRLRNRRDQDADRLQLARRLGHHQLPGLRQPHTAAVLAHQRLNLLGHPFGRPLP